MSRDSALVSVVQLASELDQECPPVILDVRWRLNAPDGREAFLEGHIPGARYVHLDDVLSRHGQPRDGRHPLPEAGVLAAQLARLGVRANDRVVTLDDMHSWAACRAWWVLRDAGFSSVRVLDGGWAAWQAAGLPVETGNSEWDAIEETPVQTGQLAPLDIDAAARVARIGTLIDARAPERYRGEIEPLDPQAGHIPGAINVPVTQLLEPDGRFKSEAELRVVFEANGALDRAPLGVYCGSGVSATPIVFALHLLGIDAALYPGSWSQWSNTPGRDVATGSEPERD